jgi:hypothetical protein
LNTKAKRRITSKSIPFNPSQASRVFEIVKAFRDERIFLCKRRYDNFDKFKSYFVNKYPFLIVPSLPEGEGLAGLVVSSNEEFYERRRKQLQFFLNYIYNVPFLRETQEFKKFISDPEFDYGRFKIESTVLFPEGEKYSEPMLQYVQKLGGKMLGNTVQMETINQDLRGQEEFYIALLENFQKSQKIIVSIRLF